MVSEKFDAQELYFTTKGLMMNRGMEACLCGWVDTDGAQYDVRLFWVTKNGRGHPFTQTGLQELSDRWTN